MILSPFINSNFEGFSDYFGYRIPIQDIRKADQTIISYLCNYSSELIIYLLLNKVQQFNSQSNRLSLSMLVVKFYA